VGSITVRDPESCELAHIHG